MESMKSSSSVRLDAGPVVVEVPTMTVGSLARHIETNVEPVRRSSHVGNQPAMELAIMAGLPVGVDVLLVDTIQGNDRYSRPNQIIRTGTAEQLVSNRRSSGHVVGSLVAADRQQSLSDIHQRALDSLPLNNRPVAMMEYFGKHPQVLGAVVSACVELGHATRRVEPGGKITQSQSHVDGPIYGLDADHGTLLPLNGMMAMDALLSHEAGSDSTLHLAGPDMVRYTLDVARMKEVGEVMTRACSNLGVIQRPHRYRVLNAQNLGVIPEQSQHELLETGRTVDLSHAENNLLAPNC